ncbi:Protein PME-5 a [Aphelenchoides avenae]|nr:Protein PME-5 a [Aphelenchus avenae]
MTSGRMNVHMLGHATAAIEATRGAREGNNAFIRYDNNARLETGEGQFLVESGISFEMLEEITSLPGSGLTKHHFSDKIVYAVRMGHRKLAASLIEHFYDYGFNKLHKETLRNDAEPLEKFAPISVTKKANENKKITPIHTAAINPNAAYLKELCVHAADPNEPDSENWYTIHYAAVCEGDGPLRLLLERETPIVLLNKIKESPLHCAARAGRVKNVELLVQALRKMPAPIVEDDAHDIDAEPAPKKAKPVVDPATNHMNAKDKHGHTPLHLAVKYGRYDVVDFLLKQPEINVEATTIASDNKLTPLIMACQNGDRRMADLLIEKGHAFVEQKLPSAACFIGASLTLL